MKEQAVIEGDLSMFKRIITVVTVGAALSTVCGAWGASSSGLIVVPGEDGDQGVTAKFVSTSGLPLFATSDQAWNRNGPGMAGGLVVNLKPGFTAANLSFNQASLNSLQPIAQGSFGVRVKVRGGGVVQALAYSWQDNGNKTHYGISYVPGSTGGLLEEGKFNLLVNTNLSKLQSNGTLSSGLVYSSTGNAPKNNAKNFQLLSIGVAVADNDGHSGPVQAYFQQFNVNGAFLSQDLTTVLNFSSLSNISDLGTSIRECTENALKTLKQIGVAFCP